MSRFERAWYNFWGFERADLKDLNTAYEDLSGLDATSNYAGLSCSGTMKKR